MATNVSPSNPPAAEWVRKISSTDLNDALREGFSDFMAKRGDLLLVGLLYPAIGLIAALVTLGGLRIEYFFPIAAGISLLGPVAAAGFYELARRREASLDSSWSHFLDVVKRPAFESMVVVVAILLLIFGAWVAVAGLLFELTVGVSSATMGGFLDRLFTTPEGWALILLGNLAGAVFAFLVLTLSVVSMPMLVDRDVGAGNAIRTSIAAVRRNPVVMLRWGIIVGVLLVLGSIPAFIGLAFVLPWLGYATLHLYTKVVDRSMLPPDPA